MSNVPQRSLGSEKGCVRIARMFRQQFQRAMSYVLGENHAGYCKVFRLLDRWQW